MKINVWRSVLGIVKAHGMDHLELLLAPLRWVALKAAASGRGVLEDPLTAHACRLEAPPLLAFSALAWQKMILAYSSVASAFTKFTSWARWRQE